MTELVHELLLKTAARFPNAEGLVYRAERIPYHELASQVDSFAQGLLKQGLGRADRVAVYLEKRIEIIVGLFGIAAGGGVFVPINPLLKPEQVAYILADCNVRVLVTSADRFRRRSVTK